MNPNHPKGRFNPYPAYKPSSVPWLGDVPAHWAVLTFKRVGKFTSGAGFPIDEQGNLNADLPFFKVSDMNLPNNSKFMVDSNNSVSCDTAARLGATVFPAGSIIFPKVGGALLTNKRRVVVNPCCIDNNLMGCVVRRGDPEYVLFQLENIDLATITKPGPVPAISEREMGEVRTTLPPRAEQAAIVRYLDHADRRIRRYINGKERLIALLEEEKQAIINQAVTRGLDPNVPLKPSGVQWLGDVPAHWEVRRLKTICDMQSGEGITSETIEPVGPYPVYGGNGIRGYSDDYTHEGEFALIRAARCIVWQRASGPRPILGIRARCSSEPIPKSRFGLV